MNCYSCSFSLIDVCTPEIMDDLEKGTFEWPALAAGYKYVMLCPYAAWQPIYATRICELDANYVDGSNSSQAIWATQDIYYCPGPPANEQAKRMIQGVN